MHIKFDSSAAKNDSNEPLTVNLHRLMQAKGISEAELARKTNTPQPTLHKILAGKTEDPRISTLKALADFFEVSMEDLISPSSTFRKNTSSKSTQSIPVISWKECLRNHFIKDLTATNWDNWVVCEFISENAYGLISKPAMEPRFPRGTILIVDTSLTPEDGDILIVHYPNTEDATLREISNDGPVKLLLPLNSNAEPTKLTDDIKILGVLAKSVFSFHA